MDIDSNPLPRSDPAPRETPTYGRDSLAVNLQTLSFGLFLALLVVVVLAVVFYQPGSIEENRLARALVIGAVVALFVVPMAALYIWLTIHLGAVERLAEAARKLAGGEYEHPVPTERLPGESAELASALEELRISIVRQLELLGAHRTLTAEILDGLGEGLLAIDREKKVVLANIRFEELFAFGGDPLGKPFLEVFRSASLVAAFEAALGGKESFARVAVDVAGARKQIEIRVFPVTAFEDVAAVALFIDVTRMEQLERVRRDFIADFSHEVRTPLAGIRTAVETLDHGGLEKEQEEHLRKILMRQLVRIENLAQEVGELKQIESGEVQLDLRPVALGPLLRALCEDFSRRPAARGLRIQFSGENAQVTADSQKIEQVFANLIDNAVKYGANGGEIRVELIDDAAGASVRVTDFGNGIPEAEQERIFNRFYRVDRSRTAEGMGTGLGLAIAKHLVQLHGGTLTVQSAAGKGATFEVRLPRSN